jgi:hypothetical protein
MNGDPVGLCRDCRHARRVTTPRSVFWLCGRSATDPSFPKYPRLPVLACHGYEPGGDPPREAAEDAAPADD